MSKMVANKDFNFNQALNILFQLLATDPVAPAEGQYWYNSTSKKFKYRTDAATIDASDAATLAGQVAAYYLDRANHTGAQAESTVTGLVADLAAKVPTSRTVNGHALSADVTVTKGDVGLGSVDNAQQLPMSYLDTDTALAADSDAKVPSQKAVKTYVDSAVVGLLDDRGNYDASVNTFPASGGSGAAGAVKKGDIWVVSVAGVLGGVAVNVGDQVRAIVDTPGQTASNWAVSEANIGYVPENSANKDTDVTLAANSDTKYPSQKAIKAYTDTGLATKQNSLGFTAENVANKDTDGTMAADSDTKYPSQKAVRTYVAAAVGVHKYSALIGDGAASSFAITQATHGCASDRSNSVFLVEESTGVQVEADVTQGATGTVTVAFAVVPASNQYRVNIVG